MKKLLLLLTAILCISYMTPAQFNIGKLKKKVNSNKTKTKQVDSAKINSDAVILDNILLDKFRFLRPNAALQINELRAMNLPQSLDKTRNFKITYKDESGKSLAEFTSNAQAPVSKRSWLLSNFRGVDQASEDFIFTKPGNYYVEFSANGRVFDRYNFTLVEYNGPGQKRLIANGGWNELAYIHYDNTHRKPQIEFSLYLRNMMHGVGSKPENQGKYTAKIVRVADKKIIAWSNKDMRSRLTPNKWWIRFNMFFLDANKPATLDPQTLLTKDGKYNVEFNYEGKLFGTYSFSVAGGKFQGLSEFNGEKIGSDGTVIWMKKQ